MQYTGKTNEWELTMHGKRSFHRLNHVRIIDGRERADMAISLGISANGG